jgi:hypothetical protein
LPNSSTAAPSSSAPASRICAMPLPLTGPAPMARRSPPIIRQDAR